MDDDGDERAAALEESQAAEASLGVGVGGAPAVQVSDFHPSRPTTSSLLKQSTGAGQQLPASGTTEEPTLRNLFSLWEIYLGDLSG